ncbi:MAG: hypothetical protein J6Q78_05900 [Clostridia bacterium]|nr:hypothetical protein [Clostridia bacterium]
MNKDNNIDDILKLLKNSVEGEEATDTNYGDSEARSSEDISEEVLKKQLRDQYMGELSEIETDSSDEGEDSYALDDDFLKEAVADESVAEETEEIEEIEEIEEPEEAYEIQEELGEIIIDEDLEEGAEEEPVLSEEIDEYAELDEYIEQIQAEIEEQEEDESLFELGENEEDIESRAENTNTEALVASMLAISSDMEASQNEGEEELLQDIEYIESEPTEEETETYDEIVFASEKDSFQDNILDEALGAEVSYDEDFDDEDINKEAEISDQATEEAEEERISLKELLTDRSNDPKIEEDHALELQEEESTSSSKYGDDYSYNSEQEEDKESEISLPDDIDELDDSVFDIMMQMGCYEEAKASLKRNVTEESKQESQEISVKEQQREQDKERLEEALFDYQVEKKNSLLRLIGIGVITLILLLYELLPIFDVSFKGIFDYENYPVAYSLIGLQLVVFDIIIMYRRLWKGIRSVFTTDRSVDNVVSFTVGVVVLYDILSLFGVSEKMPIAFNFIISVLMLLLCIDEFISIITKINGCEIVLSDDAKYEFSKCARFGGVAEKMYRGGYSTERSVFVMNGTDNIDMYANDIIADEKLISKKSKILLIPAFVLAAVMSMVSVILEGEFISAVGSFIITLLLMLPIGDVVINLSLYTCARYKLVKKGSVVNVQKVIEAFENGDSVVFSDLHLYKKCQPKNMGIVFLRDGQQSLVIRGLAGVCSAIGGPMSELFADASKKLQPADVRINKIWHNGIDAFIDRRYSFLMGDAKFFEKYGIVFPENKDKTGREGVSTLCIAIGGLPVAKVSVKYDIEPKFEVIAERLYECGISTVIETYDPLINSSFVASCRNTGSAPINVVHKNIADKDGNKKEIEDRDGRGILSCSSRLKLAEALVWCRKIITIRRLSGIFSCVFATLGLLLSCAAIVLGITVDINEFYVFAYLLITLLISFLAVNKYIPKKSYFTVEALQKSNRKKNTKNRGHLKNEQGNQ